MPLYIVLELNNAIISVHETVNAANKLTHKLRIDRMTQIYRFYILVQPVNKTFFGVSIVSYSASMAKIIM